MHNIVMIQGCRFHLTVDYDSPTGITIKQESATSFTVSWTAPPTRPGYDRVTGYMIYYQTVGGGDVGSAHVGRDDTQHTINGRLNGQNYSITMVTLSERLPSNVTDPVTITLGKCVACTTSSYGYCACVLNIIYASNVVLLMQSHLQMLHM